eukprot:4006242-Amphidinium_carterae.1
MLSSMLRVSLLCGRHSQDSKRQTLWQQTQRLQLTNRSLSFSSWSARIPFDADELLESPAVAAFIQQEFKRTFNLAQVCIAPDGTVFLLHSWVGSSSTLALQSLCKESSRPKGRPMFCWSVMQGGKVKNGAER